MKEGEEGVVIWLMNAVVELEVVLEVIVMCKCSSSHKRSIDGRLFSMERSKQGPPPLFLLVMYLF